MDPFSTALKEIAETRAMVESLVISSERFDYPKAKVALRDLTKKVQALTRAQARFAVLLKEREPNIRVVNFRDSSAPRNAHKS